MAYSFNLSSLVYLIHKHAQNYNSDTIITLPNIFTDRFLSKLFKIQKKKKKKKTTKILANVMRWHYIRVLYTLNNDKD